jgi:hypothetical protein
MPRHTLPSFLHCANVFLIASMMRSIVGANVDVWEELQLLKGDTVGLSYTRTEVVSHVGQP